MRLLLIFVALLWPTLAYSHDSPLDPYGCHSNKLRFGNTTSRECHVGLLSGNTYTSTSAEYQAYIAAQTLSLDALKADVTTLKADVAVIKAKVTAPLGTIGIKWVANTEPDLAGYRVYCGTETKVYTVIVTVAKTQQTATIPNIPSGTWYCAVTAYDQTGNESGFSQEVSKVMP